MDNKPLTRLDWGEAWMMCRECGAKLYSFDGNQDSATSCPYKKNERGECTDEPRNKNFLPLKT